VNWSKSTRDGWEGSEGPITGAADKVGAAKEALECAGVVFVESNGGEVGVRLRS
jgi:hypothetical protein